MLLVGEVNAVGEGRVDGGFEHLPDSLNDVLAVFCRIDDPADVFLEGIGTATALVEASLAVDEEDLLDDAEDVE